MKRILPFILTMCLLICGNRLLAQTISAEVISNSGETYKKNNLSLDWTLGESVIDAFSSDPYIHTQGFHQTYLKTSKTENEFLKSTISVYPNPVNDYLNLRIKKVRGDINIELFDATGKKILSKNLNSIENYKIHMKPYANGNYLLHVNSDENKVFNIIKSSKK